MLTICLNKLKTSLQVVINHDLAFERLQAISGGGVLKLIKKLIKDIVIAVFPHPGCSFNVVENRDLWHYLSAVYARRKWQFLIEDHLSFAPVPGSDHDGRRGLCETRRDSTW